MRRVVPCASRLAGCCAALLSPAATAVDRWPSPPPPSGLAQFRIHSNCTKVLLVPTEHLTQTARSYHLLFFCKSLRRQPSLMVQPGPTTSEEGRSAGLPDLSQISLAPEWRRSAGSWQRPASTARTAATSGGSDGGGSGSGAAPAGSLTGRHSSQPTARDAGRLEKWRRRAEPQPPHSLQRADRQPSPLRADRRRLDEPQLFPPQARLPAFRPHGPPPAQAGLPRPPFVPIKSWCN